MSVILSAIWIITGIGICIATGIGIGMYFSQTPEWHPPISGPCVFSGNGRPGFCDNGDRRF